MNESEIFFQVKQVLENLLPEDYDQIPKEVIDSIDKRAKKTDRAILDFTVPLDQINLDYKVVEVLNEILKLVPKKESQNYVQNNKEENQYLNTIESLERKIKEIESSNNYLKKQNEILTYKINCIPKFIRKLFIKDTNFLLKTKNN